MIIKSYQVKVDNVVSNIDIISGDDYTNIYRIYIPNVGEATAAIMTKIREQLLRESNLAIGEIFDPENIKNLKNKFMKRAEILITKEIPSIDTETKNILIGSLMQEMLGLGKLEILISDDNLEEIAVNSPKDYVWVFHRDYGWLKTNILIEKDDIIRNYASIIARRVGREITNLSPCLDAHLITGDRANATLFPISSKGNTITIRKFARKAWTIVDFLESKTISTDVAAFLWTMIHYEMNVIIAGGTSSGKTALLNTLMPFIQPDHRVVSIEDTREIQLPDFLQWVPLSTRSANPEGKGEVSMLDLMVNSLRMRPDRIVVGEIRRADQAEVLFEAMHTGHSVYSTLHAETAEQVINRMTNPPINIPEIMLEALHGIVVQYRNRRKGIRRVFQVAEVLKTPPMEFVNNVSRINILYKLAADDKIEPFAESKRIFNELRMYTGMDKTEILKEIDEKKTILNWLVKNKVNIVNDIGRIMAEYYTNHERILNAALKNDSPSKFCG